MKETTKTKLYTFDEMKETVISCSAKVIARLVKDERNSNPIGIMAIIADAGARIATEMDILHEKGEL